jgi:hypothetical protein
MNGLENIVLEFERVTKYPLVSFFTKYRDFMINSYPEIDRFFSGKVEGIDNSHLVALKELTSECKDVLAQFKNFSNKFSKCGYWELMEYIDDLNTTIEKINKLPKFRRTSLTKKGYQPVVQVSSSVGGFRTMEDVANSVKQLNQDNSNWVDLMLSNDLNEGDWEIDELTPIDVFVNNRTDIVVTTILDQPIGKRIYGKDIKRKIEFDENDLVRVEYQENVDQKCIILLKLNRGDVPENMLFGKNMNAIGGVSVKAFSYPELISGIEANFMQNDLFEYVYVREFTFENGDVYATIDIKTKYDYKTEKKIVI